MKTKRRRDTVEGYLFILPVVLGLLFFTIGPMIASLYISFTNIRSCVRPNGSACATMSTW
ncbi:MAG: hypothetical protein R2867_41160 [Caldilineaceae bacterium]